MKFKWKKSLFVFAVLIIFSASVIFVHGLVKSLEENLVIEFMNILLFLVSLIILWPYLVVVLATETELVFLGITWNMVVFWFGILFNIFYVYVLSCTLIAVKDMIMRE